jgi:hypothetical protein
MCLSTDTVVNKVSYIAKVATTNKVCDNTVKDQNIVIKDAEATSSTSNEVIRVSKNEALIYIMRSR